MPSRFVRRWFAFFTVITVAQPSFATEPESTAAQKTHWAWRKPVRPLLPDVNDRKWVRNPVDHFILARLEAARLRPAAKSAPEQLIRRVTFDLIGLQPTPAEIDAFVQDRSPRAWEKVIERLLASPHYGERWGRHWLDLARYADSNGYEFDEIRPDVWRYRDHVIGAFNSDRPYDRFIKEHLAGDELYPGDTAALIATGFNLLGPDMTDASNQAQRRQNTLDDMTETTGLVFLGMTIGCARCHDHKSEPIPQADFFRLEAFFTPVVFRKDLIIATAQQRAAHERKLQTYRALSKPMNGALAALEEPYRMKLRGNRLAKLSDAARLAHETSPEKRTAKQNELVAQTARLLGVSSQEIMAALTPLDRRRHDELQHSLQALARHKPPALPLAMGLHDGPDPVKTFH
jgi:hypothetical protein